MEYLERKTLSIPGTLRFVSQTGNEEIEIKPGLYFLSVFCFDKRDRKEVLLEAISHRKKLLNEETRDFSMSGFVQVLAGATASYPEKQLASLFVDDGAKTVMTVGKTDDGSVVRVKISTETA